MKLVRLSAWAAVSCAATHPVLGPAALYNVTHYAGKNAYSKHGYGGFELDNNTDAPLHLSVDECLNHCIYTRKCTCTVFQPLDGGCWAYAGCHPRAFVDDPNFDVYILHLHTTTLTTTSTTSTSTTTFHASTSMKRIADTVTVATIGAVMVAGVGIYVKVGNMAAVSQKKSALLLTLGLFHCVGQFIPWVAFNLHGVDCQRGMDWTVHLFYAVLLALAAPFLGGIYLESVARGKLPVFGQRGLPFFVFSYCTTVVNGIDTYSDSLVTAKALECAKEVKGLGALAHAIFINFWAGMAAQVLILALVGGFSTSGTHWRALKWAMLTFADVLPHSHVRLRPLPAEVAAAGEDEVRRHLKVEHHLDQELVSTGGLGFMLRVDADAKVFAQTLILVRLVTEDLPQPILQFLLGERVGFGIDVCLSMVSGVLLSMYGIFELLADDDRRPELTSPSEDDSPESEMTSDEED